MSVDLIPRLLLGSVPVLLLLTTLIYLDSYKLVSLRRVIGLMLIGGAVAGGSYLVNRALTATLEIEPRAYSRYVAPVIEEIAKGFFLVWLIRSHRLGFLVDTAICGFAIGTGFAVVENIYYLRRMPDAHLVVWLVRGCGTALMHGGATALFGMASRALSERRSGLHVTAWLPGFATAVALHSAFNHFFLSPVLSTVGILLALPPLLFWVFERGERSLEGWLHAGFDADAELLELIHTGEVSQSPAGQYLHSLKEKFHGVVVADMLCLLRLHAELSLRAKGLLMMRQGGFTVTLDDETRAKMAELDYLERSIGLTGRLAMAPFLRGSSRELWQLKMLGK